MKDQDLFEMNTLQKRLKSFKKWPFKEPSKCTKERMAEAGFYFTGSKKEPDLARCFICLKELDGWEEEDDPWEEHKKHAPTCAFIILNKSENEMTYGEIRKLEEKRAINKLDKAADNMMKEFQKQVTKVREILEEMK